MKHYRCALRTGSSITIQLENDEIFFAREIKGSLIWPTATNPGYYAILCQKEAFNDAGKAPLVLLCERTEEKLMEFFKAMLAHGQDFSCSDWIVDLRRENRDYLNLFNEYSRYHQSSYITLTRAKFPGHFERATGLIRDWAGSLEIGKGVMRDQLGRVTANDLTRDADSFFAIKALCFIISDLEANPWRTQSFGQGGISQKSIDRKDARGWT